MKRTMALFLAVLMIAGLLSGFTGAAAADDPKAEIISSKDTAIIVTKGDPGRLRGDTLNSLAYLTFNRLVYDYLFTRNSKGEYEPCICTDYELDEDSLGVTLHLREGVKFHDGNTMTAEDVLASLQFGMKDTSSGSQLAFIDFENSAPVDDNTLYLKFKEINGVWQASFLAIGIVEKSAYEAAGSPEEFYLDPMTTSAYVLEDWVSDDHLSFKAFPEHWYGAPKIENIIVRIIPESSVQLMELQTGGVDLLFNLSLEDYEMATSMDNVTGFDKQPSIVTMFLGCNLNNPTLNNTKLRKAIALAIDWHAICDGAFSGAADTCYGPLGVNALGFDENLLTSYPYSAQDKEQAKALLAESGYDGSTLRILVDDTPARQLMAEQLYNMLTDVGLNVVIDKKDQSTTDDIEAHTNDYELYIRGAYNNSGDVVTFFRTSVGYGAIHADADPEFGAVYTKYLQDIGAEVDMQKRIALYKEFQNAFVEDMMYWIPGVQVKIYAAYNSALQGVEVPGEFWIWNNAYFE